MLAACNDYCKNGGICTLDSNSDPQCNCSVIHFDGNICQRPVTTPLPNTTANPACAAFEDLCGPGFCIIKSDGKLGCQCPPPYMGDFCDSIMSANPGKP